MSIIAAAIFALLTTLLSFGDDPPGPFPAVKDWNSFVISLHHGCGRAPPSCPIYNVTISGNGEVTFEGMRAVRALGYHTRHVAPSAVRALFAKFRAVRFFSLPDTRVMDSSARIGIAFDNHHRSLAAERVSGLAQAIEKAAGVEPWVRGQ